MQLNPAEISELIKSRIEGLGASTDIRNQGTVVSVTDGIVRIHGLSDAMQGEMQGMNNFMDDLKKTTQPAAKAGAGASAAPAQPSSEKQSSSYRSAKMMRAQPDPSQRATARLVVPDVPLSAAARQALAGDPALMRTIVTGGDTAEIVERDDKVDAFYNSIFRNLVSHMIENPSSISSAAELLFVARNIERIGDHATNVAEMVHYAATGSYLTDREDTAGA